jgi:hypothetical protein
MLEGPKAVAIGNVLHNHFLHRVMKCQGLGIGESIDDVVMDLMSIKYKLMGYLLLTISCLELKKKKLKHSSTQALTS